MVRRAVVSFVLVLAGCRGNKTPPSEDAAVSAPETAPSTTTSATTTTSAPSPAAPREASVRASTLFRCSGERAKPSVSIQARGSLVQIVVEGQGPCPGEAESWSVKVDAPRDPGDERRRGDIRVSSHGGRPSRCLCHGTGTFEVHPVPRGTYHVEVAGGFNRRVAGEVVVP